MINQKISQHFRLSEFTYSITASRKGIDNTMPSKYMKYVRKLANDVLEPIRNAYGLPIHISSGYRCEKLNKAIGGAKNSCHMYGSAVDIESIVGRNKDLWDVIVKLIKEGKISVRSLIWEKGTKENPAWIHIDVNNAYNSFRENKIIYLN